MSLGIFTALLTAAAITILSPAGAHAQDARRVQVALVDSLSSPSARAEVVRFSGGRPDLILLRSSTVTADDLVAAMLTYDQVRASRPARPGLIARTTLVGGSPVDAVPDAVRRRAQLILREVKSSAPARIGNLGRGRWGEFDVSR
jgi:hypothetical protein